MYERMIYRYSMEGATERVIVQVEPWVVSPTGGGASVGRVCSRSTECGPDRNAHLLVVVDQPRFGAVRGHAPAPAKAFVEALGTCCTFVASEYNTSNWRCPMASGSMAARNKHGERRHSSEQNKDIIAARSMLIIAAGRPSSDRPTRQRPRSGIKSLATVLVGFLKLPIDWETAFATLVTTTCFRVVKRLLLEQAELVCGAERTGVDREQQTTRKESNRALCPHRLATCTSSSSSTATRHSTFQTMTTERTIVLNFNAKNIPFTIPSEVENVRDLKERLVSVLNCPVDEQRLILGGKILKNDDLVSTFPANVTIYVVRNRTTPSAPSNAGVASSATQNPLLAARTEQQMLTQAMQNPFVRQMFQDPQMLRTILLQSPQFRDAMQRMPELRSLVDSPDRLREMAEIITNPSALANLQASQDRMLANIDAMPGGFSALRSAYSQMSPMLNSTGGDATDDTTENDNVREAPPSETAPFPDAWNASSSSSAAAAAASPSVMPSMFPSSPSSLAATNPLMAMFAQPPVTQQTTSSTNNTPNFDANTNNFMQLLQLLSQQQQQQQNPTAMMMNPFMAPFPTMIANNATTTAAPGNGNGGAMNAQQADLLEMLQLMQLGVVDDPSLGALGGLNNNFLFGMPPSATAAAISPLSSTTTPPAAATTTTTTTTTTPTTPTMSSTITAPRPPRERLATQLAQLRDMGFTDEETCISVLLACNGNVNAALNRLLG